MTPAHRVDSDEEPSADPSSADPASAEADSAVADASEGPADDADERVPSGPPDDAYTSFEDLPHDLFGEHEVGTADAARTQRTPMTDDESNDDRERLPASESDDPIATVQALFPGRVVAIETDISPDSPEDDDAFSEGDPASGGAHHERVPDDEAKDPSR